MAVAVGSVAVPGATGNFSVTGLTFQPVAVLFWNQVSHLGPHSMCFGAATGSAEQWVTWMGTDTETSGYTVRYQEGRTDRCVWATHAPFTTIAFAASMVSLNSDGFTLNLVTRNAAGTGEGNNIYYMALGGDHIIEAHAGTVSLGASTGTTAVTAPGFQPTSLIVAHNGGDFDIGALGNPAFGVGVTDGTTHFSSCVQVQVGTAVNMRHIYRTDSVSTFWDGTDSWKIALASFDATGFTLDVTDAYVSVDHGYLAINAEGAVAGHGVQPDANSTVTHSTPYLLPEGVFFCWPGADTPSTTGSSTSPLRPGVGGGTIAEERMSAGIARSSAPFGVWTSDGYQIETSPLGFWGVGDGIVGGSNASQASANISAVREDEFDLTWSTVLDTNDRVYGWLALPGELVVSWIPQIYRRVFVAGGPGPTPTVAPAEFLLLEDGDQIELEDGSGFLTL